MISEGPVPCRATRGSAGYDIYAAEDILMCEGIWRMVDTGISLDGTERPYVMTYRELLPPRAIDQDGEEVEFGPVIREADKLYLDTWAVLVLPRSSMAVKYGLRFSNTVPLIDKDYRDTIRLHMACDRSITIQKGDRIGQLLFVPFGILSDEVRPEAERAGGFGSTGNRWTG